MKRPHRRQQGKGGLELIEEAVHLLRTAPGGALAGYYLGSLPFVLGLLYFWADMSRDAFAYQQLAGASLGMALLFLWMKFWQVVFARKLRATISIAPAAPWNLTRCRRVFLAQSALQPWGLFLLPLSLLPVLPFAWVYGFFQNLTALDDGQLPQVRALVGKALRQATLWPRQNHVVLIILLSFAFVIFLNWTIFCYMLPGLAKTLFGVETVFSRSGLGLLNTTFFAAMFGLTYLCVDPIARTVYVLRCFYGESLDSGEDLKVELKQFAFKARPVAAAFVAALSLAMTPSLIAAESPPTAAPSPGPPISGIPPPVLDRAIEEVIQQRKYSWRIPREDIARPDEGEPGVIERFFERAKRMVRATLEWLGELLRKLFARQRASSQGAASGYDWIMFLQLLLYALVAAALAALGFLLFRLLQNRRRPSAVIHGEAVQPAPDLTDEHVGADQLPEDGWTKLARELLQRGELRLAMRAFYLASLAHLAEQNLISLAKFKSNRDYELELRRRGHSFAGLLAVFGENVSVFDRIWYGMHEVTGDLVQQFATNVERIKGTRPMAPNL